MTLAFSLPSISRRRQHEAIPHAMDRRPAPDDPLPIRQATIARNILMGLSDDLRLNQEVGLPTSKILRLLGKEARALAESNDGDFSKVITLLTTYANLRGANIERKHPTMRQIHDLAKTALESTDFMAPSEAIGDIKQGYWEAAEDTSAERSFSEALDLVTTRQENLAILRNEQRARKAAQQNLLNDSGFDEAATGATPVITDEVIEHEAQKD